MIFNMCTVRNHSHYSVGRGGASIYGKQFEDELSPELKFTGN